MNLKVNKKAMIYDLDNTIYPAASIGEKLFASLFRLIIDSGAHQDNIDLIKKDVMRRPFQVVAASHRFSDELTRKGIDLLKELTYDDEIEPFSDYRDIRDIRCERFLVTTGFLNLQLSKIRGLGIENDFKEIYVVDPTTSVKTKKDVFADIMKSNGYTPPQVLVIGDDPESEIRAATELGIDTVLYDKYNLNPHARSTYKISDFRELRELE